MDQANCECWLHDFIRLPTDIFRAGSDQKSDHQRDEDDDADWCQHPIKSCHMNGEELHDSEFSNEYF